MGRTLRKLSWTHLGEKTVTWNVRGHTLAVTNPRWVVFTVTVGITALVAHLVFLRIGWYVHPPHPDLRVDVYTHSLSALAIVSIILLVNLGRRRRWHWAIPILVALLMGVFWEMGEEVVVHLSLAKLYNTPANAVQDIYMDVLGAIAAVFFHDAAMNGGGRPAGSAGQPGKTVK